MKTRIIWTKIWEDEWFDSLSQESRWLFLYLLTNPSIGLSGCFEVRNKTILYHTHLTEKQLLKAKEGLYPKVKFFENWIYMPNAQGYNGYVGDKNAVALDKEIKIIPQKVKDVLFSDNTDTLSILHTYTSDTSINHKSEIINNNIDNKYKNISDIKEEEIKQVAQKYQVTTKYVEGVLEDLENDIEAKGKDKYANKLAALRAWVKNQIKWDSEKGKSVKLKDLRPDQIEDIRKNPEKLLVYKRNGYDTTRMRTR